MRWDDLQVFLAVHRRGTVMGAADELGVSRSTINRRLEALEADAGVALVERSAEGLHVTEIGAQLVPIAERIEEDTLGAERLFAGRDYTISGPLTITVFEVAATLLAPAFDRLRREHPEIELRIAVTNRTLSLRRRESDLAVRATDAPGPDLFGRSLGTLRYGLYGTPETVELENPPWILWDERLGARGTWDLARKLGDPLRVGAIVDSAQLMLELACAGAGIALLPVAAARTRPELVARGRVPYPGTAIGVWLLTHPDLRRAARVRTAMRFMTTRAPALLT